jgi:hypothetical protein
MDEIPKSVLNDLITLGKLSESEKAERNQIFNQLNPFDRCGRTHANAWISATEKLNVEQLSSLARGLVFAEEFNSLDEISRERLVSKLKSRHKGCWTELFAKVAS